MDLPELKRLERRDVDMHLTWSDGTEHEITYDDLSTHALALSVLHKETTMNPQKISVLRSRRLQRKTNCETSWKLRISIRMDKRVFFGYPSIREDMETW